MRLRVRFVTMLCMSAIFVGTGCSAPAPQPPQPTQPAQSTGCVASQCDGAEPKEIRCDEGADSITDPEPVRTDNLEGVLEIRKATKPECNRLYWTRYVPAEGSDGAWELQQERNGESTKVQKSEDARPSIAGWTVVQYADENAKLEGCVTDVKSQQRVCTPIVTPR